MELSVQAKKSFAGFTLEADFTVSGDRIGIFGQSGGGKSTLLLSLPACIVPTRGKSASMAIAFTAVEGGYLCRPKKGG